MSSALSAGVTGLQAHQKMLDVAGNNLANVNTTGFKSSRVNFSELLSETIKKASQPTSTMGGTNPQQMGSGVGVAGITPDMSQGDIENTGSPLDMAIEGEGYFVLDDGQQKVYTRAGAFGVDSSSILIDPATGYRVQRIGSEGESDGFQVPGDSNIHVPYDAAMPAKATSNIVVSGNLSADEVLTTPQTQVIDSNISYTKKDGTAAESATKIGQLDQFSGGSGTGGQLGEDETGTITISGYNKDGTAFSSGLTFAVDKDTTVGGLITHLNDNVLSGGAKASLVNGQIQITDGASGYSKLDMSLSYKGDGSLVTPGYFKISTVGGDEVKNIIVTTYDSQGGEHTLSGAFVRTDTPNTWDLVLTSVTGNIDEIAMADRRVNDITFNPDGSYTGISGGGNASFVVTFAHDTSHPQTMDLSLGTVGGVGGLTQSAGDSTVAAGHQDGYAAGRLSTTSVNKEGVLIGAFSNGIKKNLATLQIALFQNPVALESEGGGYFTESANSGVAVATQALTGGAGTLHGGALEKSNADVATEFVNMIQAQNGFQANARTIKVANEVLQTLTSLIS